jgi:hypothetical protein
MQYPLTTYKVARDSVVKHLGMQYPFTTFSTTQHQYIQTAQLSREKSLARSDILKWLQTCRMSGKASASEILRVFVLFYVISTPKPLAGREAYAIVSVAGAAKP